MVVVARVYVPPMHFTCDSTTPQLSSPKKLGKVWFSISMKPMRLWVSNCTISQNDLRN